MKKWLVYVLGILTGIVLTIAYALVMNLSNDSGIIGLELFDEPGEYMDYSQLEVIQVGESGCALATADNSISEIVFIVSDGEQQYYDGQEIVLKKGQRAQRVGTFKYTTRADIEKTVPAVRIVGGIVSSESEQATQADDSGITMFDKPGECVSRKNFEVQKVLDSGNAIALEVIDSAYGSVLTSDLEVLILAQDDSHFYEKQIVKAPAGKCARHVGNYKYLGFKVIPVLAFM